MRSLRMQVKSSTGRMRAFACVCPTSTLDLMSIADTPSRLATFVFQHKPDGQNIVEQLVYAHCGLRCSCESTLIQPMLGIFKWFIIFSAFPCSMCLHRQRDLFIIGSLPSVMHSFHDKISCIECVFCPCTCYGMVYTRAYKNDQSAVYTTLEQRTMCIGYPRVVAYASMVNVWFCGNYRSDELVWIPRSYLIVFLDHLCKSMRIISWASIQHNRFVIVRWTWLIASHNVL